jgi:hypothetical protein
MTTLINYIGTTLWVNVHIVRRKQNNTFKSYDTTSIWILTGVVRYSLDTCFSQIY